MGKDAFADTEADFWGKTPAAQARAAFWSRIGPRLEGRRFILRRSVRDRFEQELVVARGAVVFWEGGKWCTRYRAGIFRVAPNPYLLRISDLEPKPTDSARA